MFTRCKISVKLARYYGVAAVTQEQHRNALHHFVTSVGARTLVPLKNPNSATESKVSKKKKKKKRSDQKSMNNPTQPILVLDKNKNILQGNGSAANTEYLPRPVDKQRLSNFNVLGTKLSNVAPTVVENSIVPLNEIKSKNVSLFTKLEIYFRDIDRQVAIHKTISLEKKNELLLNSPIPMAGIPLPSPLHYQVLESQPIDENVEDEIEFYGSVNNANVIGECGRPTAKSLKTGICVVVPLTTKLIHIENHQIYLHGSMLTNFAMKYIREGFLLHVQGRLCGFLSINGKVNYPESCGIHVHTEQGGSVTILRGPSQSHLRQKLIQDAFNERRKKAEEAHNNIRKEIAKTTKEVEKLVKERDMTRRESKKKVVALSVPERKKEKRERQKDEKFKILLRKKQNRLNYKVQQLSIYQKQLSKITKPKKLLKLRNKCKEWERCISQATNKIAELIRGQEDKVKASRKLKKRRALKLKEASKLDSCLTELDQDITQLQETLKKQSKKLKLQQNVLQKQLLKKPKTEKQQSQYLKNYKKKAKKFEQMWKRISNTTSLKLKKYTKQRGELRRKQEKLWMQIQFPQ